MDITLQSRLPLKGWAILYGSMVLWVKHSSWSTCYQRSLSLGVGNHHFDLRGQVFGRSRWSSVMNCGFPPRSENPCHYIKISFFISGRTGLENTFWNVFKFFMPSQFYLVNMDTWNTLEKNPKRTECKLETYPYWSILYRKPPRFWTNTLNFIAFGLWSRYFVASLGRFVKRRTWSICWVVCPGFQSPPQSLDISSMGSLQTFICHSYWEGATPDPFITGDGVHVQVLLLVFWGRNRPHSWRTNLAIFVYRNGQSHFSWMLGTCEGTEYLCFTSIQNRDISNQNCHSLFQVKKWFWSYWFKIYKPTMPRPNLGLMIPGTRGLHVVKTCVFQKEIPSLIQVSLNPKSRWRRIDEPPQLSLKNTKTLFSSVFSHGNTLPLPR